MPSLLRHSFVVSAEAIDSNRHVNNKEYLRWMEEVAIAHSTAQGWPVERYRDIGSTWFVRSHFVEYLRPAFEAMPLVVGTWVATMDRRASLRRYLFVHTQERVVLAQAETMWIFVDARTGRPAEIPPELRSAFPVLADDDPAIAEIAPGHRLPPFRGRG